MCDQTEVSYLPGDVVWVKLGPVWWPAAVCKNEEVPLEITKNLRKTPIAIVKFFQEDEYEYVQKLSNIYHYNCLKKNDFIKKGLDMYRSKNRDAPSNMKLFPEDVARAEVLTAGNPDILHDKMFQPEEKPSYVDLFPGLKKTPKKPKVEAKKKTPRVIQTPSSPRIITHPRFLKLSNGDSTDYEVRERKQEPMRAECDDEDTTQPTTYWCRECNFSTVRLNVIVLHNKTHTRQYTSAPSSAAKTVKRKNVTSSYKERLSKDDNFKDEEPVRTKIPKTNGTSSKTGKRGRPPKSAEPRTTQLLIIEKDDKIEKKDSTPKPKPSKKPQPDPFQKSLLEDWDDSDDDGLDARRGNVSSKRESEGIQNESNDDQRQKSCFDFDDSDDQLVIDKSKIKFGRKIPRVIEEKEESAIKEDKRVEEEEEEEEIEPVVRNNEEMQVDATAEERSENTEENKMEIVRNENGESTESDKMDSESKERETEADALSKEVDQLLQDVSAPTKLPEIPRSVKKEQIKMYNASLIESSTTEEEKKLCEAEAEYKHDDDIVEIVEEVAIQEKINDDSSAEESSPSVTTNAEEAPLIDESTPVVLNDDDDDDFKPEQEVQSVTEVSAKTKVAPMSIALSGFRIVQSPNSKTQEFVDKMKSLGVQISMRNAGSQQTTPVSGGAKRTLVLVKSNAAGRGRFIATTTNAAGKKFVLRTTKSPAAAVASKETTEVGSKSSPTSTSASQPAESANQLTTDNSVVSNGTVTSNTSTENVVLKKQDILAKALQDTDVMDEVSSEDRIIEAVTASDANENSTGSADMRENLTLLTSPTVISL